MRARFLRIQTAAAIRAGSVALMPILALLLPAFAQAAPDEALRRSLHQFFAQGVRWQGAEAELIGVEQWPPTRGAARWRLPRLHGHPRRFALIAEQGQGKHLKRWYVPVRAHWWAKVVVSTQPLPARALLTQAMLTTKRRDIAGLHGDAWRSVARLIGMRLTRPLPEGAVILAGHVKRPPLIRRGDIVQIVLDDGPIHIRSVGEALRSADQGERLPVRNIRSREVVQGIAESSRSVRVMIGG